MRLAVNHKFSIALITYNENCMWSTFFTVQYKLYNPPHIYNCMYTCKILERTKWDIFTVNMTAIKDAAHTCLHEMGHFRVKTRPYASFSSYWVVCGKISWNIPKYWGIRRPCLWAGRDVPISCYLNGATTILPVRGRTCAASVYPIT